jgi:hypothetical protein
MDNPNKNYFLHYEIDDYPDSGGGTYMEYVYNPNDVRDKANSLLKTYDKRFILVACGHIRQFYNLKPVEVVTRLDFED